ncbi:hypothetical protein HH303_11780 [Rhodospirillaceae bacterium KN72]|uniref:Dienelactone hydrolase n=1 Tax=Pacificispira spongiicola TaxID=2729598 RepID=A0A7Y0E0U0_9PROT|nr:hypothetical protein [Pacificispira spongiicola]NMM45163.1 hypothetical protein [Pacificispira spongiicola]
MKTLLTMATLVAATLFALPIQAADFRVGYRAFSIPSPDRDAPLPVSLWYPADGSGTEQISIGENGVFQGAMGELDAPIVAEALPLVVYYHGGFRSAPNSGAWLAHALAARGFVVAEITPPRLAQDDAGMAPAEIWKRPSDMSTVLTAVMDEPSVAGHIDPARIAALGTYLGGTSALSLAGLRLDGREYARSCDGDTGNVDCEWFAVKGVDLRDVDTDRIEADRRDDRVRLAIAIDPELAASFSRDSVATPAVPVAVIALGDRTDLTIDLGDSIPVQEASDATRFSAFNDCKPKGAAILTESGADPAICMSDDAVGRATVHTALADRIADILTSYLAKAN